jgi:DNA-binding CsgD family transcriptional regulator
VTGGLLPDPKLPGSYFLQESIAYGTGFITPCYFPYYVYKAFGLKKMRFHAFKGVFLFLVLPYLLFVTAFAITFDLSTAKNVLVVPTFYGIWVIYTLSKAVRYKYSSHVGRDQFKIESGVLFFSLFPWVGLPAISYFDLSQSIEASVTNSGFLLLLALHLKQTITKLRIEHQRLIESERQLKSWNEQLQKEVEKRTQEIERITKEERFNENCRRYQLSNREKEIARYICQGFAYREIAQQLHIAETTVAKHAQNIFEKVAVSNKMELFQKLEKIPVSK